MYLWCAYCQHLQGEVEPLASYEVTHGICAACMPLFDAAPQAGVLRVRALLFELVTAARSGEASRCEPFLARAAAEGLRPSEILVGVVQPALVRIGEQWERGEITVADEHRFTAFCTRAVELLPATPLAGPPAVLLTAQEGNAHDLGIRILQRVAHEHGVPCEVIWPGIPGEELVAICRARAIGLAGISVSMPDKAPAAIALYQRLREVAPDTRVVLGGQAFRRADAPRVPPGVEVLRSYDEFVQALPHPATGAP